MYNMLWTPEDSLGKIPDQTQLKSGGWTHYGAPQALPTFGHTPGIPATSWHVVSTVSV